MECPITHTVYKAVGFKKINMTTKPDCPGHVRFAQTDTFSGEL
jgi:hypothetical protein